MNLALGVMEAPCASPAVGAAVDAVCTVFLHGVAQGVGGEVQSRVPGHRNEGFLATPRVTAVAAMLQVTRAYHGLRYPGPRVQSVAKGLANGGGLGVYLVGMNGGDSLAVSLDPVVAPVGAGRHRVNV